MDFSASSIMGGILVASDENSDLPMDKGWKTPDLVQPKTFKQTYHNKTQYNYEINLITCIVKIMSEKIF
jgi:hypothetical protein